MLHLVNQIIQILEIRLIEGNADHVGVPVLSIKMLHNLMQIKKEIDSGMPEVEPFLFLGSPNNIPIIHTNHRLHYF